MTTCQHATTCLYGAPVSLCKVSWKLDRTVIEGCQVVMILIGTRGIRHLAIENLYTSSLSMNQFCSGSELSLSLTHMVMLMFRHRSRDRRRLHQMVTAWFLGWQVMYLEIWCYSWSGKMTVVMDSSFPNSILTWWLLCVVAALTSSDDVEESKEYNACHLLCWYWLRWVK